ncbi:hypothetical protein FACS189485_18670 [Spirochaetia bacterium]|nr:hypothetical protein FACS189485_18670 [Spirochaetia bacterium]
MNDQSGVLELGLDIGSMTVKAVVLSAENHILMSSYLRHNSRQAETLRTILAEIKEAYPETPMHVSITGSGARSLKDFLHAEFIQEVNALTLAVETLVPDARSVIELGGQDAKVIIWKGEDKRKTTLSYMNDKCAGGTGSTIDKIMAKIGISSEEAEKIMPQGRQKHQIAAKCGVFAETDVVGLLKSGIPREEIFISLCNAIVRQNLEVLVHGNVLPEKVVLLGGPNTFIPAFAHIWRDQIKAAWDMHGYTPREQNPEKSIIVPALPHFFAAIGAVFFTREDAQHREAHIIDPACLDEYISGPKETAEIEESIYSSIKNTEQTALPPLVSSAEELESFRREYAVPAFTPPVLQSGDTIEAFVGIDGGSTSTKIVLLDSKGDLLYRDYILSHGNPLEDARYLFKRMQVWRNEQKVTIKILGAGVTGYAQDILKAALNIDVAVVETVAHMKSAAALYGDVDVICDVGGQDIKVLFMKNRRVVDFKLNTQCSAGNGYFLQSMANQFNIPVEEYEDYAFRAKRAPKFNYGCAVFMEQDRVMFQQSGWTKEEMMSGLAHVLPLNIWTYVVQENNLSRLGKRFVLQGGTQKNLAAVKAQVDYIKRKVPGAEVFVHKYADIGGAIGAALELNGHTASVESAAGASAFIGIDAAAKLQFTSKNDEQTRCSGCANKCRRTFVDIETQDGTDGKDTRRVRFISGYLCEKGAADDKAQVQNETKRLQKIRSENPDISLEAAKLAFSDFDFEPLPKTKASAVSEKRTALTVGIPRLLNMFYYAPFWSTYFRTLGIKVVTSDFTNERLWSEGSKWGAIDPCFPAKAAPAHIWQLLNYKDENGKSLDAICFPIITYLATDVQNILGSTACVVQMGTPEVVKAVFTREHDVFAEKHIAYWEPVVNLDRKIEGQAQTFEYFKDRLNITEEENAWAFKQGIRATGAYLQAQRERFAGIMNRLIDEDKIGLLLVGRSYHHDPGLNHGIPQELQKRGYPIFTIDSLPVTQEFLQPLFKDEAATDISDVWVRNFNRGTNQKIWACKVAARHPNLGVIDLSSFKCGQDAPTYSYVDHILDASGTPHFNFHDIDQNRPGSTFKIRIDTIDYFLQEYQVMLARKSNDIYKSA